MDTLTAIPYKRLYDRPSRMDVCYPFSRPHNTRVITGCCAFISLYLILGLSAKGNMDRVTEVNTIGALLFGGLVASM